MDEAFALVSRAEIFDYTGAQFMQFNTVYQLLALQRANVPALRHANTLLMMPDLFHYWLTGEKVSEFTNATTTQFYNPRTCDWARDLLGKLSIPHHFLAPIVQPGTVLGHLAKQTQRNLNVAGLENINVITPATHDTGSAVAAVPASHDSYAYISSGTWSLMGIESKDPIISAQAQAFNITNEGGYGSFRILKNIMGLWLIQSCRRSWIADGSDLPYSTLMDWARQAKPLQAFVDPDDQSFLHPQDMPTAIVEYCQHSGQTAPTERANILRCALESLALKYRYTLDQMETLTGKRIEVIHVLGGGSQNTLLCQFTADACQRPVLAGPIEATAIGNILVQLIAQKEFASLKEARAVCRTSFPLATYTPQDSQAWQDAYGRFKQLLHNPSAS
jgi:rhamnulokinase